MATHEELITGLKFDESFKIALRDYYSYGFKNLQSYEKTERETVTKDWKRLNNIIENYFEWSEDYRKIMFASADSQSMEENPFHRVYRFCKYRIPNMVCFLVTLALLDEKIKFRGDLASFGLEEKEMFYLEKKLREKGNYKTSDFLHFCLNAEVFDENTGSVPMTEELKTNLKLVQKAVKDRCKIQFYYTSSSVVPDTGSTQKKKLASPYCIHKVDDYYYMLAGTKKHQLKIYLLNHMHHICQCEENVDPYEFSEDKNPQSVLEEKYVAQRKDYRMRSLTGRLDQLLNLNILSDMREKKKGDRRWTLPQLTMKVILDAGSKVDQDFEQHLSQALDFFSRYYFLGEAGTFLRDRIGGEKRSPFRFRHEYFMQSLNDFNLIDLLYAIENNLWCRIKYSHGTEGRETELLCYPIEIRISSMQGREFLMYYEPFKRSYSALRLEFIENIIELYSDTVAKNILSETGYHPSPETIDSDIMNARESITYSWGVSAVGAQNGNAVEKIKPHAVAFKITYRPETEYFIENRLKREHRFGEISISRETSHIDFGIQVADEAELRPWMRSFYSRIVACSGMENGSFSLEHDVEDLVRLLLSNALVPEKSQKDFDSTKWGIPDKVQDALKKLNRKDRIQNRENCQMFNEIFSVYNYIVSDVFVRMSSAGDHESYTEDEIDHMIRESFNTYYLEIGEKTEEIFPGEIKKLILSDYFMEKITKMVPIRPGSIFKEEKRVTSYRPKFQCSSDLNFYRDIVPLSAFELRWLKTVMEDCKEKLCLFMSKEEIGALTQLIQKSASEIQMFPVAKVNFFDRFHFPEEYARREADVMRVLLESIYREKIVKITYHAMKGNIIRGKFRPIVLEFSKRNSRFQGFFQKCSSGKIYTMNISRIRNVVETDISFDYESANLALLQWRHDSRTYVEVEFYNNRNMVDRILTEFSPWEKKCTYDADTGLYRLTIFYYKEDETDIVIRLLGYGAKLRLVDKTHPIYLELLLRTMRQMELMVKQEIENGRVPKVPEEVER